MTSSISHKFTFFRSFVLVMLLGCGLLCMFFASWILYLRPWLKFSARFDLWLDQNHCLIQAWCDSKYLLAPPLGVLFLLGALALFSLALWWEFRMPAAWKAAIDEQQMKYTRLTLGALTVGAVIVQAYQLLHNATPPSDIMWLLGIGTLFALGITLDLPRSQQLQKTIADLLVAVGIAVTVLGVAGFIMDLSPRLPSILLLGGGVVTLAISSRWAVSLGSSYGYVDHAIMLAMALLHLVLALSIVWYWQFSFVGDEWGFFETARNLNLGSADLQWFDLRDSNGYHTVFSMQLQAWVMQLFGNHVVTWRLSSILTGVYSTPALYVLGWWLGGRKAGLLSAGVFAVSHAVICFAMVPYNNTQALVPIAVGMALFVFATKSESTLRYFLVGMMLGMGFIVYGLARLAILPIGIFWLIYQWPNLRTAFQRMVEIGAGGFVVALPVLLNLASWKSLLKATPVESEVAQNSTDVLIQMARNVISGLLAFATNPTNTHFVVGPYVDPLSAILVVIGLAYCLVTIGRHRASLAWLVSSLLLLVAMSGIQQYDRISTTRMFSSVIIFALYAGVGGAKLLMGVLPGNRQQYAGIAVVLAAILWVNQYHIAYVTLPNIEKPQIPRIVQQFQESTGTDGRGMPIFVLQENPADSNLKLVLQGYDFARDYIVFLTVEEALQLDHLCAAGDEAAMLIIPVDFPRVDAIRTRIQQCWPGFEEVAIRNRADEKILIRFVTAQGGTELRLSPQERYQQQTPPFAFSSPDVQGVVVAPDDSLFLLASESHKVLHVSATGDHLNTFTLIQNYPRAIALYGEDQLVVTGGEAKLVWYDFAGNVMQKSLRTDALAQPFGLVVLANGELLVADVSHRHLAHVSAQGDVLDTFTIDTVQIPSALALAPDQESLWINDAGSGKLVQIALPERTLLQEISTQPHGAEDSVRLAVLANGDLLQAIPRQRRVAQTRPSGELLRIWSGFEGPTGIALDSTGGMWVVDQRLERVHHLSTYHGSPQAAVDMPEIGIETSSSTASGETIPTVDPSGIDEGSTLPSHLLSPLPTVVP